MSRALSDFEKRMKSYEAVTNSDKLVPNMPYIIRVDGHKFSKLLHSVEKPFDELITKVMCRTAQCMAKDIPDFKIAYTQSDEITIICYNDDRYNQETWFNGRITKIETLSASKATRYFNKNFYECLLELEDTLLNVEDDRCNKNSLKLHEVYGRILGNAEFDARVFNIPEWDCINNLIYRQRECIRNSVNNIARTKFKQKDIDKLTTEQVKVLLKTNGVELESYNKGNLQGFIVTSNGQLIEADIFSEHRDEFSEMTGLKE